MALLRLAGRSKERSSGGSFTLKPLQSEQPLAFFSFDSSTRTVLALDREHQCTSRLLMCCICALRNVYTLQKGAFEWAPSQ